MERIYDEWEGIAIFEFPIIARDRTVDLLNAIQALSQT
jgi:hypothetical protein